MVCSDGVQLLAIIGGITVYLAIGAAVAFLIRELIRDKNISDGDRDAFIVLGGILWPVALVVLVFWLIGSVLVNLLFGVTVFDLRRTEERLNAKIKGNGNIDSLDEVKPSFKVGDIITGAKVQTDEDGDVIGYGTLYEGCRCRVIDSDDGTGDDDCMEIVLIGHKDLKAHEDKIGKRFNVPPRNFVLVKGKKANKKAAAKRFKKSVKRSKR